MTLRNYIDKLKHYFPFSKEEHAGFWLGVLALGFVASFTKWGVERFDLAAGLQNLLGYCIVAAVVLFIHHSGQRMAALALGFKAEQRFWWHGIVLSLLLAFVTNGKIRFLACSGTIIHLLAVHRLGAFRYGPNIATIAKIALAGPAANIAFAIVVKAFEFIGLPHGIAQPFFAFSIAFAGWNMLPIPPLDGAKVFYWSRLAYVFFFSTIASYIIMASLFQIYSLLTALAIGVACWLVFLLTLERIWTK